MQMLSPRKDRETSACVCVCWTRTSLSVSLSFFHSSTRSDCLNFKPKYICYHTEKTGKSPTVVSLLSEVLPLVHPTRLPNLWSDLSNCTDREASGEAKNKKQTSLNNHFHLLSPNRSRLCTRNGCYASECALSCKVNSHQPDAQCV